MCAIRMIDEDGDYVVDQNWQKNNEAKWVTRDIPEDKKIIGLYMSTGGAGHAIRSLGFVLWQPNPDAVE